MHPTTASVELDTLPHTIASTRQRVLDRIRSRTFHGSLERFTADTPAWQRRLHHPYLEGRVAPLVVAAILVLTQSPDGSFPRGAGTTVVLFLLAWPLLLRSLRVSRFAGEVVLVGYSATDARNLMALYDRSLASVRRARGRKDELYQAARQLEPELEYTARGLAGLSFRIDHSEEGAALVAKFRRSRDQHLTALAEVVAVLEVAAAPTAAHAVPAYDDADLLDALHAAKDGLGAARRAN